MCRGDPTDNTAVRSSNVMQNTANTLGISREEQDDYAFESYRRTEEAIESGVFSNEIVGVETGGEIVREDEEVRRFDPATFRTSRTLWGDTIGWGSCSKVTSVPA